MAELAAVFEEPLSGLGAEDGAVPYFAGHGQVDPHGALRKLDRHEF